MAIFELGSALIIVAVLLFFLPTTRRGRTIWWMVWLVLFIMSGIISATEEGDSISGSFDRGYDIAYFPHVVLHFVLLIVFIPMAIFSFLGLSAKNKIYWLLSLAVFFLVNIAWNIALTPVVNPNPQQKVVVTGKFFYDKGYRLLAINGYETTSPIVNFIIVLPSILIDGEKHPYGNFMPHAFQATQIDCCNYELVFYRDYFLPGLPKWVERDNSIHFEFTKPGDYTKTAGLHTGAPIFIKQGVIANIGCNNDPTSAEFLSDCLSAKYIGNGAGQSNPVFDFIWVDKTATKAKD